MPAIAALGAYAAAAIGLTGTALLIGGAIAAVGIAYGISRIINGNPNKGKNSAQDSQGGRVQVPPATNNKIPVVYGNAYINGIITDARLITTDQKINDTMYYCIVLSETCQSGSPTYTIDDIYWNDLRLVFNATDKYKVIEGRKNVDNPDGITEDFIDKNFVLDGKHFVEIRVYAGGTAAGNQIFPTTGTTPAYTYWAGNDGSWTSRHEMKGLVYAIVKVTYNGEKGFTGLPNMTFRMNNTVSNPADVWYDYMTGVRYGAGIPAADIDTTAKTAWKNFCDEDITYTDKDGATNQSFARYAINGPIDTSRDVKTNIDIIMQNAGAWLSYNVATGLWSPIIKKAVTAGELGLPATFFTASRSTNELTVTNFPAGRIEAGQLLYNSAGTLIGTISAQLTPTAGETAGQIGRYTTSTSGSISSTTFYTLPATMLSFTDDNISSGITISSTRLDDLYNSVEAEFYDKHNKDQKAYARNAIDTDDRNPNEPDNQLRLSLDLCNNSMQADLLGQLELRQSRDDLVVEFTTNQYGIQAQAGDVVSITSELYDWNPKYFRVMRVKEQETEEGGLVAQIQALEYNPDVYTVEPLAEFSTSANIGIGVYAASPNLPQPPVVEITQIDTDVAIPNFQLQVKIPTTGGPYDEIELYYTEGWDPMSITGSIVPGTGSNGAPVGDGLLTVTAIDYGALNVGDYFSVGATSFTVTEQLTNNPVSKTFASGGAQFTNTVTLNNTTGLLIGNNLIGTGLPTLGAHIKAIAGSQVTLDTSFSAQAAGTYTVFGGLGTYVVDTSATLSGTTTLYDLPVDSDYKYLKKATPEGNNPTFTNGETVTIVITEVPANTATYRRWFVKARMGIKKRFGSFSTPTITDLDGNFRYTPSPTGGGSLNNLTDVLITSPNEGQTLYYDATVSKWKNNSILEVDDTATRGGIVVGEGITQPMITFARQADGVNAMYGIRGINADTDPWFVGGGSTGLDAGYLEIATGDNAGDPAGDASPIYVRQYDGYSGGANVPWYGGTGTVVNQLTLLDEDGHTIIPNNLTVDNVLYVDATNNRVGIFKSVPDVTLDVNGAAGISGNLNVAGGTLFVDASTNKVGINNSSPSFPLDVTGNVYVNGQYTQTGANLRLNNNDDGVDVNLNFNSGKTLKWSHGNQRFEFNGDIATNYEKLYLNSDANAADVYIYVNGISNYIKFDNSNTLFDFTDTVLSRENLRAYGNVYVNDNADVSDGYLYYHNGAEYLRWRNTESTFELSDDLRVNGDLLVDQNGTITLNLAVNGGDLTTTASTFNLINANATTVNFAQAGTAISIGATTGTTTIRNANTVVAGDLAVNGDELTSSSSTFNLLATPTTLYIGNNATLITLGDPFDAGVVNVQYDLQVDNDATIYGDITQVSPTVSALNKNIVTTSIYTQFSNSLYYDPTYVNIDTWDKTLYRSAKYILSIQSATSPSRFQCMEFMVLHDGTTAYMNTYSDMFATENTVLLQVNISGSNVQVQATAVLPVGISGGITYITGQRILLAV